MAHYATRLERALTSWPHLRTALTCHIYVPSPFTHINNLVKYHWEYLSTVPRPTPNRAHPHLTQNEQFHPTWHNSPITPYNIVPFYYHCVPPISTHREHTSHVWHTYPPQSTLSQYLTAYKNVATIFPCPPRHTIRFPAQSSATSMHNYSEAHLSRHRHIPPINAFSYM